MGSKIGKKRRVFAPARNDCIEVRGARQNNLKGVDVDLPLGKLTVITGPSGSGKSSLAFETIYAEGQRRYVETFSPYMRQFLDRMDKPHVDDIRGIPPAIAIEQANPVKTSRSTVGTMTEINDYLKLLWPRVARAFCPNCGREIRPETAHSITDQILRDCVGKHILITFWVSVPPKTEPQKFFGFLQQQGYLRVWINSQVVRVDDADPKIKRLGARVQVIQDRIAIAGENRVRLAEAIETALRFGKGQVTAIQLEENIEHRTSNVAGGTDHRSRITDQQFFFSTGWHCAYCDLDIRPPTVGLFSFNNPLGACPECRGFGRTIAIDLNKAIPDRALTIKQGVVRVFRGAEFGESQKDLLRACARKEIDINVPFEELPKADQDFVIEGDKRSGEYSDEDYEHDRWYGVRGFFRWLESKTYKMHVRVLLSRYRAYITCPKCNSGRYQPETLNYKISAIRNAQSSILRTLPEFQAFSISEARDFLRAIHIPANDKTAQMLRDEICARLSYLCEVGVGYLTLDRSTRTLSGGETQRVNLTTCLGASLVNTLFVMDEPSIGLHPRDVGQLVRVMHNLRDKGNTLLVVEHEGQIIRAADNLIDLGPGRGEHGGELVWNGTLDEFLARNSANLRREHFTHAGKGILPSSTSGQLSNANNAAANRFHFSRSSSPQHAGALQSLTRDYLTGRKSILIPKSRRRWASSINILGAREHNLKSIDVELPLGVFTCVTGVSGSGKSTLVHDVLHRNLQRAKGQSPHQGAGACKSITGAHRISDVVMVDQSPLARTPRSSPILYLGLFDRVRELFAAQPEAMAQGLTAGAFSFNSGNGRCERCSGAGYEKIEMQFLSDLYVRCAECDGKRFQSHVLKVRLHGKSIHDVLELTVSQAIEFFSRLGERRETHTRQSFLCEGEAEAEREARVDRCIQISNGLEVLEEVGLGYLRLGQPLSTLSGGESQRLKLVGHLAETDSTDHPMSNAQPVNEEAIGNLFIFDEPTTGLHFDDVAMLLRLFQRLVEGGHSLVVIEHNLEVIKCADWIVDLGPEAGDAGGEVVATGTPEQIARVENSHTGRFLAQVLGSAGGLLETTTSIYADEGDEFALRAAEEPFDQWPNRARHRRALPNAQNRNGAIHVHGAREHNLKNLDLKIPREQLVVITGLSGSGKSTLAFDILFAEGQRRFLDSMSPYARQFVEQLEKPDVDLVSGLPPTVAIEQRVTRGGGKSTVGTITEVYHFLRLLFAKTGTQFCPDCDLPVAKQSVASMVKQIQTAAQRGPLKMLAPLVKARKGFHTDVVRWAERQGFDTLYVDGKLVPVAHFRKLERFKEHSIDVVVGVIDRQRMVNAREIAGRALEIGRGTARLLDSKNRSTVVSTEMSCPNCGRAFEELDPRLFSFNSPHGMCEECGGFGQIWDPDFQTGASRDDESALESELMAERESEWVEEDEARQCPSCHGSRLNTVARHVRVQGCTINHFTNLSASEAARKIDKLKFTGRNRTIAIGLIPEIQQRLHFMETVGLGYLALGRSAKTLSGGESQRIRLAAQLGSNLRGVLYVLDEPTIGLHPRDNLRLLETLAVLRNKGNSLVVVEHDEETMRRADHIVDLGPRAGIHGGEVVAAGTLREIERNPHSETARCLKSPVCHPIRGSRRSLRAVESWIEIRGARANNLKSIDVRFPVGRLSVITGISGSGKSTLMHDVIWPAVRDQLNERKRSSNGDLFQLVSGAQKIEAVYEVDQSPIGKTSRSTPGTYVKVFDEIRNLYAQLPVSRVRGYSASRFSFNAEGGRCETCKGQGVIKLEMNFLPRSYVPCEDCHGRRYNPQTLEILYNEKSIGDVMEMTIEEASEFFSAHPKIACPLSLLDDTGLGYLKLGQPSPTLSGGEAQRLKLVTQLKRGVSRDADERLRKMRKPGSTLYLLEEPTIGLHMADVQLLLNVLHRLVDEGNTVIVIEHNLTVIAEADYIVDLGPEAGDAGGKVVACGTPEQIAKNRVSRTAPFLRKVLNATSQQTTAVSHGAN